MTEIDTLYCSSLDRKLARAKRLYEQLGSELMVMPEVKLKLERLESLSEDLYQQMASMTMFSLCRECGEKAEGGCCSAFMANETDGVLLLINLMLGVEVTPQRDDSFECRYLGLKGCILRVKPIFCLNYNCRKILTGNGPGVLKELDRAASAVLREQTELEGILLERIKLL